MNEGQLPYLETFSKAAELCNFTGTAKALRDAGLVDVRGEAQRRLYRVRPEPLRAIDDWLGPYRRMWAARLDAARKVAMSDAVLTGRGRRG